MKVRIYKMKRLQEELRRATLIGLGSGSTVAQFVEELAKDGAAVKRLRVVPSSRQIHLVASKCGLKVTSSDFVTKLDLVVDGADQVDDRRRIIKGGGGALLKEKVIWEAAKSIFVIANEDKFVRSIDRPVPVEVAPSAVELVSSKLSSLGGRPLVRLLEKGYPFITENGNMVLDVAFGVIANADALERQIKALTGVVEVGLFNFPDVSIYKVDGDEVEEF